jgi:hypothetical protein
MRTQKLITGAAVNLLEQKQCVYGDFTKNRENKHKPGDVARNGPRKAGTSGNDLDRHHEPTSQGRGSKGGCGAALRGAAQICPPSSLVLGSSYSGKRALADADGNFGVLEPRCIVFLSPPSLFSFFPSPLPMTMFDVFGNVHLECWNAGLIVVVMLTKCKRNSGAVNGLAT